MYVWCIIICVRKQACVNKYFYSQNKNGRVDHKIGIVGAIYCSWGSHNGNNDRLYFLSKSLHMVTAAMKLKDACSLEGKL